MKNSNFFICTSPIGYYRVEYCDNRLNKLKLEQQKPNYFGIESPFASEVQRQINEYFNRQRQIFDIEIDWSRFTPFQEAVYIELTKIAYGQTKTYKQIAEAIGNPRATRAVGMANSQNPIHLIIPCHRVIGANGALTGYAGGLEAKRALLKLEQIW